MLWDHWSELSFRAWSYKRCRLLVVFGSTCWTCCFVWQGEPGRPGPPGAPGEAVRISLCASMHVTERKSRWEKQRVTEWRVSERWKKEWTKEGRKEGRKKEGRKEGRKKEGRKEEKRKEGRKEEKRKEGRKEETKEEKMKTEGVKKKEKQKQIRIKKKKKKKKKKMEGIKRGGESERRGGGEYTPHRVCACVCVCVVLVLVCVCRGDLDRYLDLSFFELCCVVHADLNAFCRDNLAYPALMAAAVHLANRWVDGSNPAVIQILGWASN